MKDIDEFFAYARERHSVYLRRTAGLPREEWTKDKILRQYRFCNVFRELDRTTVWFRENVRDKLRDRPEVLLATVVFRMFNRVATGEALFCQPDLFDEKKTAFEVFLESGNTAHLRRAIRKLCGEGPYVTGAYIISSPPGYSKLDGVLRIIRNFDRDSGWREVASGNEVLPHLETYWRWLRDQSYLGSFHSYEIVTDLRHTALFERAPDAMTWANVGPGARRGVNRVFGRDKKFRVSDDQALEEMREILAASCDAGHWPQFVRGQVVHRNYDIKMVGAVTEKQWPAWELREVEHTLCEFDKYQRVKLGEGRPRGVFR